MDTRLDIPMPSDLRERVAREAETEQRKVAQMGRLLIEEALEARKARRREERRQTRKESVTA